MMNKYSLKDIAAECGVGEGAILAYIKYRIESGLEVPNPIPYQRSYYVYDEEGAKTIIELFKNKKRGEMAEYNYKHNWGKDYRAKHPRTSKHNKQD